MSNHTLPAPGVIDSVDEATRIHDTTGADGRTGAGERAVPYHCPYCAEEDLRPLGATPGAWHCWTCTRTFSVKHLGMQAPTPSRPLTPITTAAPTPTGGTR